MKFLIFSTVIWISTLTFGYVQEGVHHTTESATRALKEEIERLNKTASSITKVENMHHELKEMLETMIDDGKIMLENVEEFLQHPLNQLHLMRRYADEWRNIKKKMLDIDVLRTQIITSQTPLYDTETIIRSGVSFLQRLDDIYGLRAANFSRGIISGAPSSNEALTADDCIKIAVEAYTQGCYSQCADWMAEAYLRARDGETTQHSTYSIKKDFITCNEKDELPDTFDYQQYKKLCRQEDVNEGNQNELTCFLKYNEEHPWTRFTPVKVERISVKPNITVYHELIGKREIEHWKEKTTKKLLTSTIAGVDTMVQSMSYSNTSKDDREINATMRRLSLIDGLQWQNIDKLEINHEKRQVSTTFSRSTSPYTSTEYDFNVLIFLSTVEQGGALVFQSPPLSVAPSSGTVVTWEEGLTVAECPVLYGDKWTATLTAKPLVQNINFGQYNPIPIDWSFFDDTDIEEDFDDDDDDLIYISPFLDL